MAKRSAALNIIFGADSSQLDRALGESQKKLRNLSADMKKLGGQMSIGLTAPLVALGAKSVQTFADFEYSMKKVKAVSGATDQEFQKLTDQAKELGRSTVFTASQVSGLQLEYSKLGFTAGEIDQVTAATLNLAQATDSDLSQAAEVAGSTLRAFGLDASQTTHVTDVMAKSFSSSALDMNRFQESMKYVAPVAKSAGIGIEQTTAMLSVLANNGIKGSQAGTALRRIISELGSTGGDVAQAIKNLAAEGLNLADAKDEVGRSAQSALLVLGENMDVVDELASVYDNAGGAAKAMADEMNDSTEGAIARMNSAIEGMNNAIGEALAPLIISITESIGEWAQAFTDLSPAAQKIIIAIGAMVAALGPLLFIAGQVLAIKGNLAAMYLRVGQAAIVASGNTKAMAAANTIAGRSAAMAAGKVKVLGSAMKAIPFAFMIAGLQSLYDKISRAREEIENLKMEELRLDARDKSFDELIQDLENLDTKQVLARMKDMSKVQASLNEFIATANGAPSMFLGQEGFGDAANMLIPKSEIDKLEERRKELQDQIDAGLETFGQSALDMAIAERISALSNSVKRQDQAAAKALKDAEFAAAVKKIGDDLEANIAAIEAKQLIKEDEIQKQKDLAQAYSDASKAASALGLEDDAKKYAAKARALESYSDKLEIRTKMTEDLTDALAELEANQFVDPDEIQKQNDLADAYREAAKSAFIIGDLDLANEYLDQANAAKTLADQMQEIKDQADDQKKAFEDLFASVGLAYDQGTSSVGQLLFVLENTGEEIKEQTEDIGDTFDEFGERLEETMRSTAQNLAFTLGDMVGQMASGAASFGEMTAAFADIAGGLLQALGQIAIEVGTIAIGTGAALEAIKKALETLNPIVAIAAGIALVALGSIVKSKLGKAAKGGGGDVPAFAEGGMVTGKTLAWVGDNASGKEAIVPFEKMGRFLEMAGGSSGSQMVEVKGVLKGSDIHLSNLRSGYDYKRNRG